MANYSIRIKNGDHEIEVTADHLSEMRELMDDATEKFFPNTNFLDKKMNA